MLTQAFKYNIIKLKKGNRKKTNSSNEMIKKKLTIEETDYNMA